MKQVRFRRIVQYGVMERPYRPYMVLTMYYYIMMIMWSALLIGFFPEFNTSFYPIGLFWIISIILWTISAIFIITIDCYYVKEKEGGR